MPSSYEQIERYLVADDVLYERIDAGLKVVFVTQHFVNQDDGRQSLTVYVTLSEDGENIEVVAPRVYDLRTAVAAGPVCEMLLSINFQSRTFRWEIDRRDGEIRGMISAFLAGGPITHDAFRRLLALMPRTIDFWHPVIQRVMATGTLPPAPPRSVDPRLEQAIEEAGGLEGLRDLFRRFGTGGG